jgi:glycosyltransferase involved in cell wall biosynthesis
MRILIDARESGSSTGRYVDKLVEHMHKLKPLHEVLVLAKSPRIQFFKEIAPDFEIIKSDFKEFTFDEQTGLLKHVNNLKPDLVHFTMPQQPVRYKGLKLTTIHDLTTLRFENPAKNPFVFRSKQLVYGRVVKRVARESAAVLTPSKFVKQDVAQYANISLNKIAVTYEAADRITDAAEPISRLKDKQFIMYVGRATPHKNLARLVEAFAILNKKYPDLMLALAGKSDRNYKRLEALASDKRLAHRVVFTDFVTEGELRWMYENTAAYVFPSLSEGFGLPTLEAMVHGAPVVCSNATCLPEINGEAAVYFDPKTTFDIAKKISGVLSDSKLRGRLIRAGKLQAAKYSWRDTAKRTLDIYNQALEHKNT